MWQKLGFLGREGIFAEETSIFCRKGLINLLFDLSFRNFGFELR
jgi:hypothetical protein